MEQGKERYCNKQSKGGMKMGLLELVKKYREEKKEVFVNGFGPGKIAAISDKIDQYAVLKFVIVNEDKKNKNNSTIETIFIPLAKIASISEGEKKGLSAALE